jgi:serine/threonine-protein kinase
VLRDKWRVDKLLGIGGMAVVYEATHINNGRRVAIKLLHPELSNNAEVRTRFLREGYVANKVEHPGTVAILDDDTSEDGSVFLVMELLEGETLEDRRDRSGTLPVHEVLSLADRLLDVLAVAHEKGVVHRDIKPENIFLTREGNVKVLDFGIARIRELQASRLTLTSAGAIGTPAFMPPEQARGRWDEVGPQSDIWAVGATMFTLLAGQLVHQAETVNELMLAAMTKPAPRIGTVVPGVPPVVAELIDCALAYDPKARWANARAMQNALRSAYQSLDRQSMVNPMGAYIADPASVSGVFTGMAPLGVPQNGVRMPQASPMSAPGGTHSLVTGQPVTMVGGAPARKGGSTTLAIVGALAGMLVVAVVLLALLLRKPTVGPATDGSASVAASAPAGSASNAPAGSASGAASEAPTASAAPTGDAPSAMPSADPAPSASSSASSPTATSKPAVNRPGKFLRNPKRPHH